MRESLAPSVSGIRARSAVLPRGHIVQSLAIRGTSCLYATAFHRYPWSFRLGRYEILREDIDVNKNVNK